MLPGLDLVQSIFSYKNVTCPELITVLHQDLSQPVQASFSQSEEVLYRSHITIFFVGRCFAKHQSGQSWSFRENSNNS